MIGYEGDFEKPKLVFSGQTEEQKKASEKSTILPALIQEAEAKMALQWYKPIQERDIGDELEKKLWDEIFPEKKDFNKT